MGYALDVLTNKNDRETPLLSRIWLPVVAGALGFGAMCYVNFGTRRPLLSGIQKHVIATLIGATAGTIGDRWNADHMAERDAVLRHYVELHPEDFPDPERKKFGEILMRWVPVR